MVSPTSNVTTIDPNVWYHLTESRVDFNSALMLTGNLTVMGLTPTNDGSRLWQFMPVSGKTNVYNLRNVGSALRAQLSTCYDSAELADSRTVPCEQPPNGDVSQQWLIEDWGDAINSRKFTNLGNQTLVLDCHPGNPVFMNSPEASGTPQPAQHWLLSSIRDINDGAFSTVFTNPLSTSTSSSTRTTSSSKTSSSTSLSVLTDASGIPTATITSVSSANTASSSHGLSTGAGIAIGVSVAAAFIFALVALLFCLRWSRQRRQDRTPLELGGEHTYYKKEMPGTSGSVAAYELNPASPPGQPASELSVGAKDAPVINEMGIGYHDRHAYEPVELSAEERAQIATKSYDPDWSKYPTSNSPGQLVRPHIPLRPDGS